MFKTVIKNILSIFLIILITSCKNTNQIDTSNIYTYEYNFESYGIYDNKVLKASTVSTLGNVIKDKKTAIFIISSPLCSSCRSLLHIVVDICLYKDLIIHNIDTYSDIYPVFGDDSLNDLLEILKTIGINSEDEIVLPIILIINNGNIDGFLKGDDLHNEDSTLIKGKIEDLLTKSILY